MDQAYLIQFAVSAAAIVLLAAVAAWARIPRKVEPLTEVAARSLIVEDLPETRIDRVWIDADGLTAVAKAGAEGVVLFRVGDGFAVRTMPWDAVCRAQPMKGRALFRFGDPGAPACAFKVAGERLPFGEAA